MMNSFDFLIIYLACGAPLGVFYFLKNHKKQNGFRLKLKTFFTFIFWLPFGFQLLLEKKANKRLAANQKRFSETDKTDKTEIEIFLFQKRFEEILQKSDLRISIFEFREIFTRYVGLTIAGNREIVEITEPEKEIFRIGNSGDGEIGAICANRRNRKRLIAHQIRARKDFFQIISRSLAVSSDRETSVKFTADFFRLLKDAEAQSELEKLSSVDLQNKKSFAVNCSESYLWNTGTHKQRSAKSTTLHLQSLTATNSSAKD